MNNLNNRKEELPLLARFVVVFSSTIVIVVSTILGLVALIILYIFISYQYDSFKYDKFRQTKPFDPVVWQKTNPQEKAYEDKKYARCYMYKDLVKNHLQFGMLYGEVIKLLGDPEWTSYYINPESKTTNYNIGGCTKQFNLETGDIRGYYLHLDFDRNSRLVAFGYYEDWHEKKNNLIKNGKSLFTCNNENICRRYIKQSNSVEEREECKKSEVESKWGYKVW